MANGIWGKIDERTGMIDNSENYAHSFTPERKEAFLKLYEENGLRTRRACDELGIGWSSLNSALQHDDEFKRRYDDVLRRYTEKLEHVSRTNALEPKATVERIFQLKALKPERYGGLTKENTARTQNLIFNINTDKMTEALKALKEISLRASGEQVPVMDGQATDNSTPDLDKMKVVDNQQDLT